MRSLFVFTLERIQRALWLVNSAAGARAERPRTTPSRVSATDADGPDGRLQFVGVVRLFDDRHGDHPFKQLPHLPDALATGNDDR
jgi:hypothetical protein